MTTSDTVFCAVELGPHAEEPLRQAAQIAAAAQAELILYHAIEFVPSIPMEGAGASLAVVDPTEETQGARQMLEADVARLFSPGSAPARIEVERIFGGVYAAILKRAEARGAGLVVLGDEPKTRLERFVLGSVAEKVVRYAHCPVLVARPSRAEGQVLVAVDFSEQSLAALRLAAEEARRRDVALCVVHCLGLSGQVAGLGGAPLVPLPPEHPGSRSAVQRQAQERLHELLGRSGTRAEVIVEDGEATHVIPALAAQMGAALVVLGATGETGLRRVLLGSVAESIVRKAPCSVLAVREGDRLTATLGRAEPPRATERETQPETQPETMTAGVDADGRIPPGASGEDF